MLFSSLYMSSRLAAAVADDAWIQAMLDVEAALARAEARAAVIPATAAEVIVLCCRADRVETERIVEEARHAGNPAEPLVRALRRLVDGDAARYVHYGATSQDILDTASMLIARRALVIVDEDLEDIARTLARLARDYRGTLMAGRTLLQHALPITFGLKAAQWLVGIVRARAALRRLRNGVLAVEFGGAAGTLALLDEAGPEVLRNLAVELGLAEPDLPWHAERSRIVEIGAALAVTAGALDKIALDITLLAQTEVGEVSESRGGQSGGSSTLPHKRNPVGAVLVRACVRQALAQADLLLHSAAQEHERAAGVWHAEWPALGTALAYTGGAASWLRESLDGLEVHPDRMRANLEATGGTIMAERIVAALSQGIARDGASDLVRSLARHAAETGENLSDLQMRDETVRAHLTTEQIERLMEPATYLGSTNAFIDRALAAYEAST